MKSKLFVFIIFIFLIYINLIYASENENKEVLIILKSNDVNYMKDSIDYIKNNGGFVNQVFIPNIIYGRLPKNFDPKGNENILSINTGIVDDNKIEDNFSKVAVKVWNQKFGVLEEIPILTSTTKNEKEPGPILNDLKIPPTSEKNKGNLLQFPPNSNPSDYLYGTVLISIVMLESNGQIDPNTESWSSTREINVINEIVNGLAWWLINTILKLI